jgi:hypothetical protein
MKLLYLFDYTFFRIVLLFVSVLGYKDEDVKQFGGIMCLSLMQNINLITIFSLIKPKGEFSDNQTMLIFLSFYLFIIGLNYLRYTKFAPLRTLEERFNNETLKVKRLKGFGVIVYCLLSVYLVSST